MEKKLKTPKIGSKWYIAKVKYHTSTKTRSIEIETIIVESYYCDTYGSDINNGLIQIKGGGSIYNWVLRDEYRKSKKLAIKREIKEYQDTIREYKLCEKKLTETLDLYYD